MTTAGEGLLADVPPHATRVTAGSAGPSITSTDSFAVRAQRSEARRVLLWSAVLVTVLALTILRRVLGGVVMAENRLYWPALVVLTVAIAGQVVLWRTLALANRQSRMLPPWLWRASAVGDLLVPTVLFTLFSFLSPRGGLVALSGPVILMFPTVVLLSVLRLRPRFTLWTGLAAALVHAALTTRAVFAGAAHESTLPVYFSYSVLLALIALAGTFVTREIRRHVVEASCEAAARERGDQLMASVQRDLAVARDIQTGLLPTGSPDFAGFDIAGMSRPADLTGGDYYDWHVLPDGRLITVLADVTGHGIGPAMVMAVCRAYARASASLLSEPAPLMRRLNELLHTDLPADRFITLAIAILDPQGRVELLSAGHGPSFLYRAASGEVRQFGGDGLPLGLSTAEAYEPVIEFQMQEGDVLLLVTDGFHEYHRPSDGEQFGIARLESALISVADKRPPAMLRELDQAVRTFAGDSPQMDDMTAVVIKRTINSATVPRTPV